MSIIHEALKKTQESMAQETVPQDLPDDESIVKRAQEALKARAPEPHVPLQERPSIRNHSRATAASNFPWKAAGLVSLSSLLVVAGFAAINIFHIHPNFKALHFSAKKPSPVLAANKPAPKIVVAAPLNLVLEGTLVSGSRRVAVINDQTYKIGDRVDDKKITAIDIDRVRLEAGNTIFVLKTRV